MSKKNYVYETTIRELPLCYMTKLFNSLNIKHV